MILLVILLNSCAKELPDSGKKGDNIFKIPYKLRAGYRVYKTDYKHIDLIDNYWEGKITLEGRESDHKMLIFFQKEDQEVEDLLIETDSQGRFFYPNPIDGEYLIRVSEKDFKTYRVKKVLAGEQFLNIDLKYQNPYLTFSYNGEQIKEFTLYYKDFASKIGPKLYSSNIKHYPALIYFKFDNIVGVKILSKPIKKSGEVKFKLYNTPLLGKMIPKNWDYFKTNFDLTLSKDLILSETPVLIKGDICFNKIDKNFYSLSIKGEGDYQLEIKGDSLCKNIKKDVTLPFELFLSEGEYKIVIKDKKDIDIKKITLLSNMAIDFEPKQREKIVFNFKNISEDEDIYYKKKITKYKKIELKDEVWEDLISEDKNYYFKYKNNPIYYLNIGDKKIFEIDFNSKKSYKGVVLDSNGYKIKGCVVYKEIDGKFQNFQFINYTQTDELGEFNIDYYPIQTKKVLITCKNFHSKIITIGQKNIVLKRR